jgi:DNA-binding NtrC family response regulator
LNAVTLPPRYEPLQRLGQGGGGEVWGVRDKVSGRVLALKLLAANAGEAEVLALVREAMALSGLEGLGVPLVVAFGSLRADGRRYLVRELVEGTSLESVLEDESGPAWIEPLARACDSLTALHRAGLLHGDLKPANIIVGAHGEGTLVDLGLAAPWREGGTSARGLTPKYAAPELLSGEPLTVRAEVYALGATLGEALARRGFELEDKTRLALARVAARATEETPSARFPSVDELASALRRAAGLAAPAAHKDDAAWPVLGVEGQAQRLLDEARALENGAALAIEGERGAGKTTLARRLAWTLGASGHAVAFIERPATNAMSPREVVELELDAWQDESASGLFVVVDDFDALDDIARVPLRRASEAGARIVAVGSRDAIARVAKKRTARFDVPPLEPRFAEDLVQRAMPSLPDALRAHLVARTGARPGALRTFVKKLAGLAIVSAEDVDAALASPARTTVPPSSMGRDDLFAALDRSLDTGRFDEASAFVTELGAAKDDDERVRIAMARARVAIGRGDAKEALAQLASVEKLARGDAERAWLATKARACLRAGSYAEAIALAAKVTAKGDDDALASDARSITGVALALTGDDAAAAVALERALAIAKSKDDVRAEAVARGSAAIAHQRAGRKSEARAAFEASLAAAEKARDAATVATMRLNLAVLAQGEGELATAIAHLEAAVDMGRRAGALLTVQQSLLNLANLDLYLGRYAHAVASIESLVAQRASLGPAARAQLLGLRAEHATRTGDIASGALIYEEAASAWETQGRMSDAAESRLEGLLWRTRAAGPLDAAELGRELDRIDEKYGDAAAREHAALAGIARAAIARLGGDEEAARRALDGAYEHASKNALREWAWQAMDARARLAAAQGSVALARRDTEAALAMLEETAAKLPRDLREVFWDDPRRRALRQAHTATMPLSSAVPLVPNVARTLASGASQHSSAFIVRPAEDRLARILEITRELAREHDIARLLTRVTDHAIALLGAERGFVVLTNETGQLEAHAARDRKGDDPHASFSRSVAEKVVETGEPVIAVSARDDARLAQAVSVHQLMIQSIACVPIRGAPIFSQGESASALGGGRTIGALYVETRLRPGHRFQDEMPTLCAFADQAAIAIENARLISENRARAEELAQTNAELAAAKDKLAQLLGRRTEQLAQVRSDLKEARAQLRSHFGYAGLVGTSAAMRKLYALIERVKDTDVPVLVTGESGTGKEVVAKAVHAAGGRSKRPFVGVNCGAIPANLLESELFGSVKGAFTGADRDRKGLFREAEGGTILLDEIGEMPQKMQAGLLRVLQEKCVRPVGGSKEESVDARVVAATNRDLAQMVEAGSFREDLFYRLHVVELRVPALRERVEDIPPLIDHFLTLYAARYRRERKTVARDALRRLCAYAWPGNVRQLEHVLLNAWLMGEADEIGADDIELPAVSGRAPSSNSETRTRSQPSSIAPRATTKAEYKASERERILSALSACNWNRVQAAKMIGVPRRTFYRRLKEFGIL